MPTDPTPPDVYRQNYDAAVELFDRGDTDKCIEKAKLSLRYVPEYIGIARGPSLT
jgi:hypothetical protein